MSSTTSNMETTSTMETTSVGAASKARLPAGGKASCISAVVEAAVAEVTVAEITVMEPLVTKVSAVRNEFVMVEECSTAMPVVAPVTPAPPKSSEEADAKSNTK